MSNYLNELGGMDAGFSQLYSSWKYDAATKASQWKERQQEKLNVLLQRGKDIEEADMDRAGAQQDEAGEEIDQENIYTSQEGVLAQEMKAQEDEEQGDVLSSRGYEDEEAGMENVQRSYEAKGQAGDEEEDRGIEIGFGVPLFVKEGGDIAKKGLKWGKKAYSAAQDLLEKTGLKEAAEEKLGDLGDAAQEAVEAGVQRAQEAVEAGVQRARDAAREFRASQVGGGDDGLGGGTEMEDLGDAGRGEQGAEFRQPQEYEDHHRWNYGDEDNPENEWTSRMSEWGSDPAEQAEVRAGVDRRNAARRAEQGEGEGEEKNWESDFNQAGDEVEPPGTGFDSTKAVPDLPAAEDPIAPFEMRPSTTEFVDNARDWKDVFGKNYLDQDRELGRAADDMFDENPEEFFSKPSTATFSPGTTEEPPDVAVSREQTELAREKADAPESTRSPAADEPGEEKAAEPGEDDFSKSMAEEKGESQTNWEDELDRAADEVKAEEETGEAGSKTVEAEGSDVTSGVDRKASQAATQQAVEDQAAYEADEAAIGQDATTADDAAEATSEAVGRVSTAEAASEAAVEEATEEGAEMAAEDEAAGGIGDFLDALGLSEDWNPLGWLISAAGVGVGIYEGVKGHHVSKLAEHHAEAVAEQAKGAEERARAYQEQAQEALTAAKATGAAAQAKGKLSQAAAAAAKLKSAAAAASAAAASATARTASAQARSASNLIPPAPKMMDFAGRYVTPVRTALAGL